MDVVVRGCRLHARRFGSSSARRLVFGLPGLSGNAEHLAVLGDGLGTGEVQFVALDWRGRGRSEHSPPGTYGWENHALDVLAIADVHGAESFSVAGHSMGGSVAMKLAELAPRRIEAVAVLDVAGRVDAGVGAVIAAAIDRLGRTYASIDDYLDTVRSEGLVDPWSDHWDRAHRYETIEVDGEVRLRTSAEAVAEDRAHTRTEDPHRRWQHLTMRTLLVRATRELRPGSGYVVPPAERDRFLGDLPGATVVEVDANHLTVLTHPSTVAAVRALLAATA